MSNQRGAEHPDSRLKLPMGPVNDVLVMDSDGFELSVLAMGRISHGYHEGQLVVGVDVRQPWWKRRKAKRVESCCD